MDRREIEQGVTDAIIGALERGTVPWSRPWNAQGIMPTSASTGKPYRGVNVWLTTVSAMEHGYKSPYWLTFRQAKTFDGSVRQGEKGTLVVFWKPLKVKDRETGEPKTIPMLRHYHVWNLDQTEDVSMPPRFTRQREPVSIPDAVSEVLVGYVDGPTVSYVPQERAFYTPATDTITLPPLETFHDGNGLAGTVFHELTHSTGHASRLDRFGDGEPQHFGSERYAREELVAEMGAQLLAAHVGVELSTDNSAAYIASWLECLRGDTGLVITAAQRAQKSTDRILPTETAEVAA